MGQTTPSAYCASLGNPSCEVLNVERIGVDAQTALYFLIKMCRNGNFETRTMMICGLAPGAAVAQCTNPGYTFSMTAGSLGGHLTGNLNVGWASGNTTFNGSTSPGGQSAFNMAATCW